MKQKLNGINFYNTFLQKMFTYFEREREQGRDRKTGSENPKQVPHCRCRAQTGAQTHEP